MTPARMSHPSGVSDEEWALCAPYLTLMKEEAPQREPPPSRELCNCFRWFVRAGCPWRLIPNDLPPWHAVQHQTRRWVRARCFENLPRTCGRSYGWRRAGYDGAKRRKGSKVHAAVDTLGHLLPLKVTAAHKQDWARVGEWALTVQAATGENVQLAYVDQGYTGAQPAADADAAAVGLRLEVVRHHEAGRSFAWAARFRRLAETLAGYHWLAFALLMLHAVLAKST